MNDKAKEEKKSDNEDSTEDISGVNNPFSGNNSKIDVDVHLEHTEDTVDAYIKEASNTTGAVAWMTRNSIAANLFMFILLFGGFWELFVPNKRFYQSLMLISSQ